jgi:hypothetical protein
LGSALSLERISVCRYAAIHSGSDRYIYRIPASRNGRRVLSALQRELVFRTFSFDFIYILNNVIMIFIYLSLAVCLFQEKPAFSLTAFILGIVGVACYFPTNPAFEMLSLSQSYWSVLPEAHAQYLAAGETLLACYKGTAFDVYYVLNALSLLLFSAAIYKSPRFNKSIGSWGLASGILMIVPSSAGIIGMAFSLLSLVPWVVFLFMLSGKLYKLAKNTPNAIKTAFHE